MARLLLPIWWVRERVMFSFNKVLFIRNGQNKAMPLGISLLALAITSACSQPESFIKNQVDTFTVDTIDNYTQASALLQADYVISVDFSWSMSSGCTYNSTYNCSSPKTTRLFDSLDTFAANLKAAGIDYRIGFVRGSKQSTTNTADSDFISGLVVTSAFNNSLTQLIRTRLGSVGQPLEGNVTSVVESTAKVLNNRGSDFLRDSAQLVMLFVSDSDDTQYTSAQLNEIASKKSNSSYISARAALAGMNSACYTDVSYPETYGEVRGTRIETAVNYLDPSGSPKFSCIMDNFSSILTNLARNVTRTTKRFKLQVPNPDISTLKVYKGNSLTEVPSSDYSYIAQSNEIVFVDGKEPALSEMLRLSYNQNYVLTSRPDVNSIEVRVDGSVVTNWTYDSAQNRILFNSKPSEGAKVQVIYKLGV